MVRSDLLCSSAGMTAALYVLCIPSLLQEPQKDHLHLWHMVTWDIAYAAYSRSILYYCRGMRSLSNSLGITQSTNRAR